MPLVYTHTAKLITIFLHIFISTITANSFAPSSQRGALHNYAYHLVAFEHNPPSVQSPDQDTLLFMGGLGEGFTTVPYVASLADRLDGWSVIEVLTTSSYYGWGTGSLKRDVEELSQAVTYIRKIRPSGRVVLMGHSTGSQDTLEYLSKAPAGAPSLDGAILQAPVSDREAMLYLMGNDSYSAALSFVTTWIAKGKGEEIIPIQHRGPFKAYPICARRWYSLLAPLGPNGIPQGDDDYFSSDISEAVMKSTFDRIKTNTKLLFLFSGADEYMSSSIDKDALLKRWYRAAAAGGIVVDTKNSGTVPGANHRYEGVPESATDELYERVKMFLGGLDGGFS